MNISELNLSEYTEEVVAYVSGAVVKSLKKKIHCPVCLMNLELEKEVQSFSSLQRRKAYGKLTSASYDVFTIIKVAEKVLRCQSPKTLLKNNIMAVLLVKCLRELPLQSLFSEHEHLYEVPMEDHKNILIRLILDQFFLIRLNHEATSLKPFDMHVRTKFNNIIKFKGQ